MVRKYVYGWSSEKFHLDWSQSFLFLFIYLFILFFCLKVQISRTFWRMGLASALYTFTYIVEGLGTQVGVKDSFKIRNVWWNFGSLKIDKLIAVNQNKCYCVGRTDRLKLLNTRHWNSSYNAYTGCNRRNGPDFGRAFLMFNYTEKPQNTYIQSSMVTEI